jgi:hypothetical protein
MDHWPFDDTLLEEKAMAAKKGAPSKTSHIKARTKDYEWKYQKRIQYWKN